MNNKDSDVWRVTVHPLADKDMRALKRNNPDMFGRMMSALKILQRRDNVFDLPGSLETIYSYPYATDCVRFKSSWHKWRVVLRLVEDNQPVRITPEHRPAHNCYLQIIFVDERANTTYSAALNVRHVEVLRADSVR